MRKDNFDFHNSTVLKPLSLFQGRVQGFNFRPHAHEDFTFSLPKKGVQSFFCRGAQHKAVAHEISTINAEEIHDGHAELESGLWFETFYINAPFLHALAQELLGKNIGSFYFKEIKRKDTTLYYKMLYLSSLLKQKNHEPLEVQNLFYEVMHELIKKYGAFRKEELAVMKDASLAKKACEYMQENLQSKLNLDDVAKHVGLSNSYFSRSFSKTMGLSPVQYVNMKRVLLAKQAIESEDDLAQIAQACGFCDQSHMNRRFKEALGISPGEFKKALSC